MNVTRTMSICVLLGLLATLFYPNLLDAGTVQTTKNTLTGFDTFGFPLRKHGLDLLGAGMRRMFLTEAYSVGLYSIMPEPLKTLAASNLASTIADANGRLLGPDSVLCLKFHRHTTAEYM